MLGFCLSGLDVRFLGGLDACLYDRVVCEFRVTSEFRSVAINCLHMQIRNKSPYLALLFLFLPVSRLQ